MRATRGTGARLVNAVLVLLPVLVAGLRPEPAVASPERASIDHVRVLGPGRHEVIVRVQDELGAPVERLEQDLRLTLDGRGVGETRSE